MAPPADTAGPAHDKLSAAPACGSCHAPAHVTSAFSSICATHNSDCALCHASTRSTVVNTIAAGRAGTPVNCLNCHDGSSDGADGHGTTCDTAGKVHNMLSAATACANCHTVSTFAEICATHKSDCAVCHAYTKPDVVKAIADGRSGIAVDCWSCHTGSATGAPSHSSGSHTLHLTDPNGPQAWCDACHDLRHIPLFADGQDLAHTTACDGCHSVDGSPVAKRYWNNPGSSTGAPGSWRAVEGEASFCGSCHDATPGNTQPRESGKNAFNVIGDGATYGFYLTGHGRPDGNYSRLSWQDAAAAGNPAANQGCPACHDLGSRHFNNPDKRLRDGYHVDQANSNCNQCHKDGGMATADPQFYTTSSVYEGSAHGGKLCTECHEVHGAKGNFAGMAVADKQNLCYGCHTQEKVMNDAISGSDMANNIQQAFGLASKHALGTSFAITGKTYELECTSCHNVHVVTGRYWDAPKNLSPVSRFTANTKVWGAAQGEKMHDYAAAGNGTYQPPVSDTFTAEQLPDYPTFCLDCHGSGTINHNNEKVSPPYFGITWDGDPHGRLTAGPPCTSYQGGNCNCTASYPDWRGVGEAGGESNEPAWKVPRSRGFTAFTRHPFDQERRIAGVNFVLSCTTCHEAHGSKYPKLQRLVKTAEAGPQYPGKGGAGCNVCHSYNTPWHDGMSCGSASCHRTIDIHRQQHQTGGPASYAFDRTRPAYIKFDNDAYDVTDSGTWKNHGRWLKSNTSVESGVYGTGADGLAKHAAIFDGATDMVELGTRKHVAYLGSADSTDDKRKTYVYFEMKNNLTLEAWIRPDALTGRRVIMSNEIGGANYSLSLRDDVPGAAGPRLVLQLYLQDSPNQWRGAYSSVAIAPAVWTHVAASYDAAATDGRRIKVYVNGQEVTANTGSGEFSQPATNAEIREGSAANPASLKQRFVIGANPDGTREFFKGRIDEVMVYNITRTQAQIAADTTVTVAPVTLISAVAADFSQAGPGIQEGDRVTIRFSGATNGAPITSANIDAALPLSAGHSWLDGAGAIGQASWSTTAADNDTLTVTFTAEGGAPTIAFGDTISVADEQITDGYGREINSSVLLSGTFGVAPISGAIAHWPLDDGAAGTAPQIIADMVGTYPCTLGPTSAAESANDPSWTTQAKAGNALYFDGGYRYAACGNQPAFSFSPESKFSLELWARFDAVGSTPRMLLTKIGQNYSDANFRGWQLYKDSSDLLTFLLIDSLPSGTPRNYLRRVTAAKVTAGPWYHVVVTYDGHTYPNATGGDINIYVNGVLSNGAVQDSNPASVQTTINSYPLRIGMRGTGGTTNAYPFKGLLDEVTVYNRVLSAEEVWSRFVR